MNEKEKMIIELVNQRKLTHPDEPMLYKGTPYTPDQIIAEIKQRTPVGKTVVEDLIGDMWTKVMKSLELSGYVG